MKTRRKQGARTLRWTKSEFYRLAELGFFHGRRVELIEGRLVVQSPQHSPHSTAILLTTHALGICFGPAYQVRVQLPLDLGPISESEPDLAVVFGNLRQFSTAHPGRADLIVEVSDTTLSYDRNYKASLYARSGIADYWILNLVDNRVEVYRDPVVDSSQPHGWRYASVTEFVLPSAVCPLALPGQSLPVADLLP